MRGRVLIVAGLLTVSFVAGNLRARQRRAGDATIAPPTATTAAALAPATPTAATRAPATKHAPRFTPPPLPADDPGVADLVNAPREPTPEMVTARNDETDRRLLELFGSRFPDGKRNAVRAAQVAWMREHQHAVQDYYRGDIDRAQLALRIHQNMLTWASSIEAALSADEFRRYTDLEPGADPYVQLVPPGAEVGAPAPEGP